MAHGAVAYHIGKAGAFLGVDIIQRNGFVLDAFCGDNGRGVIVHAFNKVIRDIKIGIMNNDSYAFFGAVCPYPFGRAAKDGKQHSARCEA